MRGKGAKSARRGVMDEGLATGGGDGGNNGGPIELENNAAGIHRRIIVGDGDINGAGRVRPAARRRKRAYEGVSRGLRDNVQVIQPFVGIGPSVLGPEAE